MERFKLTEEHLKLLRRMNVGWGDDVPEIDSKRPYGNSDVDADVIGIIHGPFQWGDDWERQSFKVGSTTYGKDELNRLGKLHRETETALAIILQTGTFQPGVYVLRGWRDWQLEAQTP